MSVGAEVQFVRQSYELSRHEVGEASNLSVRQVAMIEGDALVPSPELLQRVLRGMLTAAEPRVSIADQPDQSFTDRVFYNAANGAIVERKLADTGVVVSWHDGLAVTLASTEAEPLIAFLNEKYEIRRVGKTMLRGFRKADSQDASSPPHMEVLT